MPSEAASAGAASCGWRREPGAERTSTSAPTPAPASSARSSSSERVECPIVYATSPTASMYPLPACDRSDRSGGARRGDRGPAREEAVQPAAARVTRAGERRQPEGFLHRAQHAVVVHGRVLARTPPDLG